MRDNCICLLEGGMRQDSRIVVWAPLEETEKELVTALSHGNGLASDPENERVLVISELARLILGGRVEKDGTAVGEVRPGVKGILGAEWIRERGTGDWVVCTAWGIVGVAL